MIGGPALWLGERALNFVRRGCGCFVAGTVVWTDHGRVPIEEVQPNDYVFAEDEATGEMKLARVIRTFVRKSAPIVTVFVLNTAKLTAQQFDTTEEHPFYVNGKGWVPAQGLAEGDVVRAIQGEPLVVSRVEFTARLMVYNFEVEGLHNYRVGIDGVLVHNTSSACTPVARWLTESGGQFVRGKNLEDLEHILDDLIADGWKKTPLASGTANGVRYYKGNLMLIFHSGGSRYDADHFFGAPYWKWSSDHGVIKYPSR